MNPAALMPLLTGGQPKFFLERLGPLNGPKMTKKESKHERQKQSIGSAGCS